MSKTNQISTQNCVVMHMHYLQNTHLSLKAKGLFGIILTLSSDTNITLRDLEKLSTDGMSSLSEAMRELELEGYIERERKREKKGHFSGTNYIIHEIPQVPNVENSNNLKLPINKKMVNVNTSINVFNFNVSAENQELGGDQIEK